MLTNSVYLGIIIEHSLSSRHTVEQAYYRTVKQQFEPLEGSLLRS
jgi:hypothetical protein